jgi:hypothetical protein
MVPLAILGLSDLVIDLGHGYPYNPFSRGVTYAIFAGIALLGTYVPRFDGWVARIATRFSMSLVASTLFFLLSNFAVWAEGSGLGFPRTIEGLFACYAVALPFYGNMLAADLIGTATLFGLDALATRLGFQTSANVPSLGKVAESPTT